MAAGRHDAAGRSTGPGSVVHFYSEFEPSAAQWLRNLADAGEIPHGCVDDRDMREIGPGELSGYTQCHFFAGIGGWPLALRLAGWPEDCEVWTGSCPCQPFSNAGKMLGTADDRHLWPTFAERIDEYRPPIVFGEQVASADGRDWLARVRLDLEGMGYAVGAADLCAAGIGAPHIRQRLYFGAIRLEHADDDGRQERREAAAAVGYGRTAYATSGARNVGMGDADSFGEREPQHTISAEPWRIPRLNVGGRSGGQWADSEWLNCQDGKARRVKSGLPLLVDGVPRQVAPALSGLGNAIAPPLGAVFVRAFINALQEMH